MIYFSSIEYYALTWAVVYELVVLGKLVCPWSVPSLMVDLSDPVMVAASFSASLI